MYIRLYITSQENTREKMIANLADGDFTYSVSNGFSLASIMAVFSN